MVVRWMCLPYSNQHPGKPAIICDGKKQFPENFSEFSIPSMFPLKASVSVWLNIYVPGEVFVLVLPWQLAYRPAAALFRFDTPCAQSFFF